jgi:hypothetical protein
MPINAGTVRENSFTENIFIVRPKEIAYKAKPAKISNHELLGNDIKSPGVLKLSPDSFSVASAKLLHSAAKTISKKVFM